MRYVYLTCLFLLNLNLAFAQSPDALTGYIVTKNNYHLTGAIGIIEHSHVGSMVEFINDFGTPYFLHPALIKGFVFYEGPAIHAYESKFYQDHWMYLRVQYASDNISLLQTPETIVKYEWQDGKVVSRTRKVVQYWVELSGDRIQPLRRFGFRSQPVSPKARAAEAPMNSFMASRRPISSGTLKSSPCVGRAASLSRWMASCE